MMDVRWQEERPVPVVAQAPTRETMRSIASDVAGSYGLTLDELRSERRPPRFAHPRQEAMALMYETGRYSLPQIGRFFGGRHHTTVLHAVRIVKARRMVGKGA